MKIVRVPLRLSFLGGGTDYPQWFERYGGAVLGAAIDKYCYVMVRDVPKAYNHNYKVVSSHLQYAQDAKEIHHPVIRALLSQYPQHREVYHWADMPANRGMGTSSAFSTAILYSFREWTNKAELAQAVMLFEQQDLKENVGCQDQYLCAVGGLHLVEFQRDWTIHHVSVESPVVPQDTLDRLEGSLMLFDTGVPHIASDVVQVQLNEMSQHVPEMKVMAAFAYEGLRALKKDDLAAFGRLVSDSWLIKRKLSPLITTPFIDHIYERGMQAGAWGGKLLGAGNSGCVLFVASPARQQAILEELGDLKHIPFRFDNDGAKVVYEGD